MKTMLSTLGLATLTAATAVPRIDLNLGQYVTPTEVNSPSAERPAGATAIHVFKLASPITREHNLGLKQPDGSPVLSRQDVTLRCALSLCSLAWALTDHCTRRVLLASLTLLTA